MRGADKCRRRSPTAFWGGYDAGQSSHLPTAAATEVSACAVALRELLELRAGLLFFSDRIFHEIGRDASQGSSC